MQSKELHKKPDSHAWRGCRYPLQFQLATIMQLYIQQLLSLILTRKKNPRLITLSSDPTGKYRQKGSRIWSLKILRESGRFPNHSFSILELLQFLYSSFKCQYKLRKYRTSSQVWLNKKKCRIIKGCSCPAHEGSKK